MPSNPRLASAIVVALLATLWAALALSRSLSDEVHVALFLLANLAVSLDLMDFGARLYLRQAGAGSGTRGWRSPTSLDLDTGSYTAYQKRVHLSPYAFLVSVYNAEGDIDDFVEAMAQYRDRFWFIDDASTDRTMQKLRLAGWRCVDGGRNRKKPAALQMLLASLPRDIETVIVLDPDFSIRDLSSSDLSSLEAVLFDFQRSGRAAVCPRISIRRDGLLARFQALEYCMSFSLGRRSLAGHSVTSGASIYRRDALESVLDSHSLSVYGEDFENSTILLGAGHEIYYDGRLELETEGKRDWRGWFSQRVGWSYGLIAVYMRHPRSIWRIASRTPSATYHYLVYTGLMVLALHPFRVVASALLALSFLTGIDRLLGLGWIPDWLAANPVYFVSAFGSQLVLTLIALLVAVPRGERVYLLPVAALYIFYALAHVVPVTVGLANWFSVRLRGRRVWGDHYQDEESLRAEIRRSREASLIRPRLGGVGQRA